MIIETQGLGKRFGKVNALQDVSLQVPENAAFALIGTNGAGKTTTIRLLVNMLSADAGSARVLGIDCRHLSHRDLLRIGYVSENQRLPERLTVDQYCAYLRALYPNWDRALEQDLRVRLELPPDRLLNKLSHGMRMKTVLVAALSFRPELLILDEPLSGLDSLVRDEVVEGLLQQAHETTILISSHELSEIENFTTHVAFMDRGRLIFHESIEAMRQRFREVSVTLSGRKNLPEYHPKSWLFPQISGHALQMVESNYQDDDFLYGQLTQCFGAVNFEVTPMSLREISKTLIREGRRGTLV